MLHYVQHDTIAVKKAIWVNIYIIAKKYYLRSKYRTYMYSNADKIEWMLIFVSEFGHKFGLTMKQAYNYLACH